MDKNLRKNTKLGEIYKNLRDVRMTVEDMDLPWSIRNHLKRGGIHHLHQILLLSEADLLMLITANSPRYSAFLVSWLEEESRRRHCAEFTEDVYFDRTLLGGDKMGTEKQFNIFEIAKIWKSEEIHTSIIAELINPYSEFHDHGQAILDLFLQIIELNKEDFIGATIATEVRTKDKRRIDMVIESETHYVPFEVKIWAKDQPNQLQSYYDFAKTTGKEVPFIVYLTPKERKPSGDLGSRPLKCITFENHILPWLKQCIARNPKQDVLEILKQLHYNIEQNIVHNYEHPLLPEICMNTALSTLEARKTECTPKYRTYTLNKPDDLEVALRIQIKGDNHVQLTIICGEENDGTPDYTNAHLRLSGAPEKFTQLMDDTFLKGSNTRRDLKKRRWELLEQHFRREDNENPYDFKDRCCKAIDEILHNCTSITTV